ncbi:MAG: dienelactone hydrolase family protein [Bacteroidia bacterium]
MVHHLSYTSERGHPMGLSLYGADLPNNSPCVLYLHGFKGFKDWGWVPYIGERFAGKGIRLLAMNFSHNGIGHNPTEFTELEKFRDNTFSLEVEEAMEVLEQYASGKLFGARPGMALGALGHSRGGGVSLLAFARHPLIKAICTWASVSTFARYPDHVIDLWQQQGYLDVTNARTGQVMQLGWQLHKDLIEHLNGKLSIRNAVSETTKPLCIIHGGADEAVPDADAQALFEWADATQAELHLIPGAGHTFGAKHPFVGTTPELEDALQYTLDFFNQHLQS